MRKIRAAGIVFGLVSLATPAMAFMHGMMGMGEPGMYNLTVGGLAGRDDANGIDKKFRQMNGVEKVHVDFKRGMVMVWMKQGDKLDEGLAEIIVKDAGFTLRAFEEVRTPAGNK